MGDAWRRRTGWIPGHGRQRELCNVSETELVASVNGGSDVSDVLVVGSSGMSTTSSRGYRIYSFSRGQCFGVIPGA